MSDWTVHLEFSDGKSNKFWRGKTDGTEFIVNYGRIGTDGQTKVKDLGSADAAEAELHKVANQKRKKGYDDVAGATESTPAAEAPAPQAVTMTITRDGRPVKLSMSTDGVAVTTEVVEMYADAAAAAAAFGRIADALVREGYQQGS